MRGHILILDCGDLLAVTRHIERSLTHEGALDECTVDDFRRAAALLRMGAYRATSTALRLDVEATNRSA